MRTSSEPVKRARIDIDATAGEGGRVAWWFTLTLAGDSAAVSSVALSVERGTLPPAGLGAIANPAPRALPRIARLLGREFRNPTSDEAKALMAERGFRKLDLESEPGRMVHLDDREDLRVLVSSTLERLGTSARHRKTCDALRALRDWIDLGTKQGVRSP